MSKFSSCPNILKEFFITLAIGLLSLPFAIIVIFVLIACIVPCIIYRSFVSFLAHKLDPDMGKLLSGMSAAQNRDFDNLHIKPYSQQVVCFRMNGPFNLNTFLETFTQRVIEKLDPTLPYTPTLQYPELRQYLTTFMGYSFLKKDKKFDVKNHFTYWKREPLEKKELSKIWEELMVKPLPKGRSPWHITIIDNYIPDQKEVETWTKSGDYKAGDPMWVVLFQIHHSLADGFACQKMLSYLADEPYVPKFSIKTTNFQRFMIFMRTGVLGFYDGLTHLLRRTDGIHTLHRPTSEHSHEYFVVESDLVPISKVKEIKDKFGVAFTAILVAAISGGIRNFLLKHKRPIPDFISTAIPFTDPEHSSRFDNRFSLAPVGLGVHMADPKERVLYVKNQFKILMGSSWIKVLDIAINCLSSLPISWFRFISQRSMFSSCYSTQPGPVKCLSAFGGKLLEVNFSFGTGSDSMGFAMSSITYNQHFRFLLFIDKNLLEGEKQQAEELMSLISGEFDVLEASAAGKDTEKERKWKESIKYD